MILIFVLIASALLFGGCMTAAGKGSELGPDYYSDFKYSPIDGRWYRTRPSPIRAARKVQAIIGTAG